MITSTTIDRPLATTLASLFHQLDVTMVVVDDDPTGTQTVQHVPVLSQWTVNVLKKEFEEKTPLFFILANTRSLPLAKAIDRVVEIGTSLKQASKQSGRNFLLVSRSDSTLRGHFPEEVYALSDAAGLFTHPLLFIPAFFEGGRITNDDIHYVNENDNWIPVAETPFAKDKSFGFTQSNLLKWIEEKSHGKITREQILSLHRDTILEDQDSITKQLASLTESQLMIVNSISYLELERVCLSIYKRLAQGQQFVFRTAASFIAAFTGIVTAPVEKQEYVQTDAGGLIVVGSYVPKTTRQVENLQRKQNVVPIEINTELIVQFPNDVSTSLQFITHQIDVHIASGKDVLVYTSRELVQRNHADEALAVGEQITDYLVNVVAGLTCTPSFIIAKGGITSNDIAIRGLGMKRAIVEGQLIPGVPLWSLGNDAKFPHMPYVVFPGNVGQDDSLSAVYEVLSTKAYSL